MRSLLDSPFRVGVPKGRALLDLLAREIWRTPDIQRLVEAAGLHPGKVDWEGTAEQVWLKVLSFAVGQGQAAARRVLGEVAIDRPALEPRFAELLADTEEAEPERPSTAAIGAFSRTPIEGLERILAASTLVDASWLDTGRIVSKAVGRLVVLGANGLRWIGTGFLVGARHVLTNAHVASAAARTITFELDFEAASSTASPKSSSWDADVSVTARSDDPEKYDWAVVKLTSAPPEEYPRLVLSAKVDPKPKDFASIVQHPQGGPKKLGIFRNVIVGVDFLDGRATYLRYLTDTDAGSSGAPVFDRNWNVVALHCKWVELTSPVEGLRYANQGVLISRISSQLEAHLV